MRMHQAAKFALWALEDSDVAEIHRRQAELQPDLAEMFDVRPQWSMLTQAQLKAKVDEEQKKPNTAVFSIRLGDAQVGFGEWSASWDTWSPYAWIVIWPEHRRKGIGRQIGMALLDKSFLENPGHVVSVSIQDQNASTISFVKALGFREIGRMRRTHMIAGEDRDTLFFDILKAEHVRGARGSRR